LNPRVVIALAVVAVSALGAIVLAAPEDEAAEPSGPRRFEGATLPAGLHAPDFTLTDQNGRSHGLAAERGKRPVVLVFYRGYW